MNQLIGGSDKAGYSLSEWCPLAGITRASYYAMAAQSRPHGTHVGKKVVITEAPAAWLSRVRDGGGIKIPKRPKKNSDSASA